MGANTIGTIFKVTRDRKLTTVHSFKYLAEVFPTSIMQGISGRFYGTDWNGGDYAKGEIFEMSPGGDTKTLYSFGGPDGSDPSGELTQDGSGTLYGSTSNGGANGKGTIFKLTLDGSLTTLHVFNSSDGSQPTTQLVQANDGNFYGTTLKGGTYDEGTVFRITPQGSLNTLYSFGCSSCKDGELPTSLIQATDGNLYGTTGGGGANGWGTIFQMSLAGTLTTLHSFNNGADGYAPVGLTQTTDGGLYGATGAGGPGAWGTLFRLDMGFPPFVTFVRKYGRVGKIGAILGQGFTGATDVSVNGTPASFTVVSDTYIKATVPPGATSGYVTVTTPTGVLTSNVPFTVIP